MQELLPCPWCGEAVMFRKALWPSDGCVDAIIHSSPSACGMVGFTTDTIDESVIAAWNTRQPPADDATVVGLSDDQRDAIATQAINERWPKGWSRSNKLAAMGMVRYAVDAAIAAMQTVKEEG